ncbi:hypothetical protein HTT03_09385 [Sulfitobacter sp. S0837]|uniref:phosphotransferase n=1 Tax=Sulfitobacter maritimus TaxID=2741719 RepID=UPI0015821165|nr:phosphotransferase [Sulfitobacter maritimus]NUH65497.1 hypothetical protein [Sulfitobacter maritimus]
MEIGDLLEPVSSETLVNALRRCSELIDRAGALELIVPETAPRSPPADATIKLIFVSEGRPSLFITVSGAGNPDLVARAVRNIEGIRGLLSERSAEPVLEPLETGVVLGRSFAVWPMLSDLPQGRVPRYLAKQLIRPDVFDWLSDVFAETHAYATAAERQVIAGHLTKLIEDTAHPDLLRRSADRAAERLENGRWVPVHCVQHSDLWMANVMLAPAGSSRSFCVIDWAGANCKGYPFFDLFRFALSSNPAMRLVKVHVREQLDQIEAEPVDAVSCVLCALGATQAQLEFFPEDLFRRMAVETIDFALKVCK